MSKARHVINATLQYNLLTAVEHQTLLQFRFESPLPGFNPNLSKPTISALNELLDKNWLGERVIDARIDILRGDLNARVPNLIIFLDCYFHVELSNAFHAKNLSRELLQRREEILISPPGVLAFLLNKEDVHWAPSATIIPLRVVLQGDSAGFRPNNKLLSMVRWWLQDAVPEDGEWEERSLAVEQQGPGSGSCALSAVSAIVSLAQDIELALMGPPLTPYPSHFTQWTESNSALVRREWLQAILHSAISCYLAQPVCQGVFMISPVTDTDAIVQISRRADAFDSNDDLDIEMVVQTPVPAIPRMFSPTLPRTPSRTPSPTSTSEEDPPSPKTAFLQVDNIPRYSPTVPSSESGSPRKEKNAPLDPTRPQYGMNFHTLADAVHFIQEYERRRGYHWRKGESVRKKDGTFLFYDDPWIVVKGTFVTRYCKATSPALHQRSFSQGPTQKFNRPF